jgi:hypothetical protein
MQKFYFVANPQWRWHTMELMPGRPIGKWEFKSDNNGTRIRFPHRLPILIFAIFAAGPWLRHLRWRFTLRTLLIATTLVAVVLSAIVLAARI